MIKLGDEENMEKMKNNTDSLVVGEVNVNLGVTSPETKINEIKNILKQKKQQILFLTEFNLPSDDKYSTLKDAISKEGYELFHEIADIAIVISKSICDNMNCERSYFEEDACKIATIELKDELKKICIKIAGIRFDIYKVEDPQKRLLAFLKYVYDNKPDLIIGDYNWTTITDKKVLEKIIYKSNNELEKDNYKDILSNISELKIPIEKRGRGYKALNCNNENTYENIVCKIISSGETSYGIWPTDLDSEEFSKKGKKRDGKTHKSRPDRAIWNENTIKKIDIQYVEVKGFDHDKMIVAKIDKLPKRDVE